MGRVILAVLAIIVMALLIVLGIPARTPGILDAGSIPAPEGIATLEEVEPGG